MTSLFTNRADYLSFRETPIKSTSVVKVGTYDAGTQYNALGGDDVVYLPETNKDVETSGYGTPLLKPFNGDNGNDRIYGGYWYSWNLLGGAGDDYLFGSARGVDALQGGKGDDVLVFNGSIAGSERAVFSGAYANYRITIGTDGIITVRDLTGADGVDTIRANPSSLDLVFKDKTIGFVALLNIPKTAGQNLSGHDLVGQDASDILRGLDENDILQGEGGFDALFGGNGNDALYGGAGEDRLWGERGKREAAGGNDKLVGGSGDDRLFGEGGNDSLFGGTGYDKMEGGAGADQMTGGAGADIFIWRSISDTGRTSGKADLARDFSFAAGDKLDLSLIDANAGLPGNQAFSFIGTGAFSAAGQIRYAHAKGETLLFLNTDADSAAEGLIRLSGLKTPTAEWFNL